MKKKNVEKEILFALERFSEPVTLDELIVAVPRPRTTMRARLSEMTRKDIIGKSYLVRGIAVYYLPKQETKEEEVVADAI
jgi:hypothetical protein